MSLLGKVGAWLRRKTPAQRYEQLCDALRNAEYSLHFSRKELHRLRGRSNRDKRAIRKAERQVARWAKRVARMRRRVKRLGPLVLRGH